MASIKFRIISLMRKRHLPRDQKGIILVTALLFLMALTLLGTTAVMVSSTDIKIGGNYKTTKESFYCAEAGLERARSVLTTADFDTVLAGGGLLNFGSSVSFGNGTYNVTVADNNDGDGNLLHDSDGKVIVTSISTSTNGSQVTLQATLQKTIPSANGLHAAVSANGPVGTLGNLIIDGRDHDIDGVYTGSGTWGVSTISTFERDGNSKVGGTTAGGSNIVPTKTDAYASVCETSAAWTTPTTPEQVLSLAAGTLKSLAQSGTGGSQYVTDPANLTFPLSGVTYVEMPSGSTWQAVDFGSSTGVLVVHNSATNAILSNTNSGTFKGVMIVDDYVHIHNTIIGAIFNLTSNPSEGNCIGNGSGSVLYSSAAVSNALNSLQSTRYTAWREVY